MSEDIVKEIDRARWVTEKNAKEFDEAAFRTCRGLLRASEDGNRPAESYENFVAELSIRYWGDPITEMKVTAAAVTVLSNRVEDDGQHFVYVDTGTDKVSALYFSALIKAGWEPHGAYGLGARPPEERCKKAKCPNLIRCRQLASL